ncbi:ATP-binding cassette transporter [Tremella mesenterica]|uniref:ATP-binding cassette transporter n=1 Tax=Tremella mesenterica TaxID=5217 RepID=A0A4Q1BGP0_TREME|nr:ATP-binding cassette transporter [Tremella mesenterica]
MAPLLSVKRLSLRRDEGEGSAILHDFNLEVEEGEVVIIKGPSGCGKTTLLKCIAELSVYQSGEILLDGKRSLDYGVPKYRTLVQYVPQRPSLLPGTPAEFLDTIRRFSSRKKTQEDQKGETDPMALAEKWGIERTMWGREWATLSGGEGQRIALALAVGIGRAEVVLLDEPTSALDEESMKTVERSLLEMLPPLRTQNSNVS